MSDKEDKCKPSRHSHFVIFVVFGFIYEPVLHYFLKNLTIEAVPNGRVQPLQASQSAVFYLFKWRG